MRSSYCSSHRSAHRSAHRRSSISSLLCSVSLCTVSLCTASLALFIGCGEDDAQRAGSSTSAQASSAVITASESAKGDQMYAEGPVLTFAGDLTEELSRDIAPGDILTVRYDPARVTECERGGRGYLQVITGYYQADDGEVQEFEYAPAYSTSGRVQSAKIEVPKGEKLAMWFSIVDNQSCQALDMNGDQKYLIRITEGDDAATGEVSHLVFKADGEVKQSGPLTAGSKFTLQYDLARLTECVSEERGIPQWGVTGHLKTDVTEEELFNVTALVDGELTAPQVELSVPEGESLYIWFSATNRYGCHQEDVGASLEITPTL